MRSIIALTTLLHACGSSTPDNEVNECSLNCVPDASTSDSGIDAHIVDSNTPQLPYRGTLFATITTQNDLENFLTVQFHFNDFTLTEIVDDEGNIFSDSKALSGFARPSFSPSRNKLAFNKVYNDAYTIQIYDLKEGALRSVTNSYSNSQLLWKDENTLFITRGGNLPNGMQTLGVYEVDIRSGDAREIVALPLQPRWTLGMGIAYDPLIDLLYFSCIPKSSLPASQAEQDEPEDDVYHTPWEICSIYSTQRDMVYGQKTQFHKEKIKLISPFLSRMNGSPLSIIYAACSVEDKVGYCSGNIDKHFSFEITHSNPSYFLTFAPSSRFAVTMDGQVYDFDSNEWTHLQSYPWQINGSNILRIMPFEWRE